MSVFHLSSFQIWSYFSGPTGFSKSLLKKPQNGIFSINVWLWGCPDSFRKNDVLPCCPGTLKHPGSQRLKPAICFIKRIQGTQRHEWLQCSSKSIPSDAQVSFNILIPGIFEYIFHRCLKPKPSCVTITGRGSFPMPCKFGIRMSLLSGIGSKKIAQPMVSQVVTQMYAEMLLPGSKG